MTIYENFEQTSFHIWLIVQQEFMLSVTQLQSFKNAGYYP